MRVRRYLAQSRKIFTPSRAQTRAREISTPNDSTFSYAQSRREGRRPYSQSAALAISRETAGGRG